MTSGESTRLKTLAARLRRARREQAAVTAVRVEREIRSLLNAIGVPDTTADGVITSGWVQDRA